MQKVLLPKAKRLWLRRLLPAVMADTADMAMAVNRLQSLEVAAQALAVTAVSRLQSLVSGEQPQTHRHLNEKPALALS